MTKPPFIPLLAVLLLLHACTTSKPLPAEESVRPGINDRYLDPDLNAEEWLDRFEIETREIFDARGAIVEAAGIEPGMDIADIGAGTGLFLSPFAEKVGVNGTVYALDIAPPFVKFIDQRAKTLGLTQVQARMCSEDSIEMPANSIDIAFICDVYHHFEYPRSSLASIHSALRPGGHIVLIDFERIPGVTRQWVLDHVRAGKEVFTQEILDAGFELVEEVEIEQFVESYYLRFRKRP